MGAPPQAGACAKGGVKSDIQCKLIEAALPAQVQPATCVKCSDGRYEVKFYCSCQTQLVRIKKKPLTHGDTCEAVMDAVEAHFESDAHRNTSADSARARWDVKALIAKQQRLRAELRGLQERGTKRSYEEAAPTLPPNPP
jgi:hypothetical protein